MAGRHVRTEGVALRERQDDGVEEDGGLGDFRLLQVVVRAGKHEVGDAEAEDAVGLFKQIFREGIFVVQRLAHSNELGALAWKYVGVHIFYRLGF